jgi:hypothetical protein
VILGEVWVHDRLQSGSKSVFSIKAMTEESLNCGPVQRYIFRDANLLPNMRKCFLIAWLAGLLAAATSIHAQTNLWQLAKDSASVHRFATLFSAQDVGSCLSTDAGIDTAIAWCKASGITHAFLEEFRDGYLAERSTLQHARDRFRAAGLLVSGCVTTTRIGKPSSGWGPEVCCYTDQPTQANLQQVFEYAASIFDEIMIDDFFFEDCKCPQCDAAREAKLVTVGTNTYPVTSDSWTDYHCALMLHVSEDRVLGPAKKINPKVRLILKYPQWYDSYQDRGYDVARETGAFDRIWVGTETRDYTNEVHWGGTVQYEGYFLMRWLGGIGGEKCGGGWYDWLGTSAPYYIGQARQTILAGARETLLFCYGGLNPAAHSHFPSSIPWPTPTGQEDTTALRANLPELLATAREVQKRQPLGIAAYKPINSEGGTDSRIFDYLGMMGLPLVPCHQFPTNAPAAFFSVHTFDDPNAATEINDYIKTGRPVLMTAPLADLLSPRLNLPAANVRVVAMPRPLDYLLVQPQDRLDQLRTPLLDALHVTFHAPDQVGLYLFSGNSWVVENFNDDAVTVVLNGKSLKIAGRGWLCHWN